MIMISACLHKTFLSTGKKVYATFVRKICIYLHGGYVVDN